MSVVLFICFAVVYRRDEKVEKQKPKRGLEEIRAKVK